MFDSASLRVIGLMSGTSVDAIDAALVTVRGSGATLAVEIEGFQSTAMPARLRERILRACDAPRGTTDFLCSLNVEIGETFAQAAIALLQAAGASADAVDLIGSHGQTVWHQGKPEGEGVPSTLQLGEPSVIAERTGVTTVADFRPRDMAAGGQGAPLVSYLDWALYRSATAGRALQNIGGIANLTVLPPGCAPEEVFAFDTGPGNMLIDAAARLATGGAQSFDEGGRLALVGRPDERLLARILGHPFLQLAPPRTTGREQFGLAYAEALWREGIAAGLQPEDVVASCTLATARSIADAYRRWVLPRVALEAIYLSGGGARNPALVAALRRELPEVPVRLLAELGGDGAAKEATAFAVLAAESLRGVATSLPGATGARHASVLGKIVPGANWPALVRRLAASAEETAGAGASTGAAMGMTLPRGAEAPSSAPASSPPPGGPRLTTEATAPEEQGSAYSTIRSPEGDSAGLRRDFSRRPGASGSTQGAEDWSIVRQPGVSAAVVIGIDGGGTKTEAVALDQAGGVLARGIAGPANIKAVGREAAAAALAAALEQLANELPRAATVVALHAALAGAGRPADVPAARALLAEVCARSALRARLGDLRPERIGVSNDALAVLAAAGAAAGVVVIAGTGSLVWGCDAAGATARAGGWGYLLGDEGSGYDLGRRALAAVLAAHDGRSPATTLTAAVLGHFELQAPPDLVDRVYSSPSARADIAGVAPLTLEAAEQGDATAQALVGATVRDLAAQAAAVVGRLQLGAAAFPVVCSGGLFRSEAFYGRFAAACAALPGARCRRSERPAAEGAALLARRAALASGGPGWA